MANIIQPTPKQIEAKQIATDPSKNIILYGGAIRGGKSFWLCLMFHSLAMMYEGSKWVMIRKSLPTLKKTLIPSFFKLYHMGINHYIEKFNNQDYIVYYKNGSQILFMAESYDTDKELNRFRGLEINGAGFDEINECQEDTFNVVNSRVFSYSHLIPNQPKPIILATCNPSTGWVKEKFYDRWKDNTLPENWSYIPSKITDNPYIPESAIEELRRTTTSLIFERMINGDWEVRENENLFAYAFEPTRNVSNEAVYQEGLPVYLSFDFNVNPATCAVFQHTHDFIYQIDEVRLSDSSIYAVTDLLKTKEYYNADFPIYVTGDASGWAREKGTRGLDSMYNIIRRELNLPITAMKAPRNNPLHKHSRVLYNSIFERHPKCIIHPKCVYSIKDNLNVKVLEDNTIDKSDSKLTHNLDCQRYYYSTFHYNFTKTIFDSVAQGE
jgi:hypothetical protein